MYPDGFNPRLMRFCALSGLIFCLMWLGGAGPATNWTYLPPPSAANSAITTTSSYSAHLVAIKIGVTVAMFSLVFYTSWSMVVSLLVKKVEGEFPILFFIQVISLAVNVAVILLISYFWGAAAFRAGDTLPQVTQMLNDMGWLGVLYTGAPFGAYQIGLGGVILMDGSPHPAYPRWSAYFCFFTAFFMFEAAGILFFKTGPFSQNGLFVFYLPMIAFFIWISTFSILALRAVNAEAARREKLAGR